MPSLICWTGEFGAFSFRYSGLCEGLRVRRRSGARVQRGHALTGGF